MKASVCAVMCLLVVLSAAQQPAPAMAPLPAGVDEAVKRQFGDNFTVVGDFATPVFTADFDGDSVEDVVVVARVQKPAQILADAELLNYKVLDPHHTYFGFGDPKVTAGFNVDEERSKTLLVIHGSGKEAWRAAAPKAKFALINVPFDRLGVVRMKFKKKVVTAITADETRVMSSLLYFDGKKYRWEPNQAVE